VPRLDIGSSSHFLRWDGTRVYSQAKIDTSYESTASKITARDLYIDGNIAFNVGGYHLITGVNYLRYTSNRYISLGSGVWHWDVGASGNEISIHNTIGAKSNILMYAMDGDFQLRVKDATSAMYISDWVTTGGNWGDGYIKLTIGTTIRYIKLDNIP